MPFTVEEYRRFGQTINMHASCAGGWEFESPRPAKSYTV